MNFWKRRISIFGKSIPLAGMLLAITAFVVLAAWLVISLTGNISVTTQSFGPFVLDPSPPGPRTNDGSKCAYSDAGGGVWTLTGTGLYPGDFCGINSMFRNDGLATGYGKVEIISSDPALIITGDCGVEVLPGETGTVGLTYELDPVLSGPDMVINGTQVQVVFSAEMPACP